MHYPRLIYLDQNYLSGFAKHKPEFAELLPVLRRAVDAGVVAVAESPVHAVESAPRPDLGLLELLRSLSAGRLLPDAPDPLLRSRMAWTIAHELPERAPRASDAADLDALALAVVHCDIVTCDAFMADVLRRMRVRCELYPGRRPDVRRLRDRLLALEHQTRA
jgi:hypothetical protein